MDDFVVDELNINDIGDVTKAVEKAGLTKLKHSHIRAWFRGHRSANWRLQPGLARNTFADPENEPRQTEFHLTQDFTALSAPLRERDQSRADIYFLQQHYGMPTRLLDWTLNPLAALFFAIEGGAAKDADHGLLIMLDAYAFASKRGLCTAGSEEFTEAMKAIFEWNDEIGPTDILAVRPPNIDKRLIAQQGCFTFHPPGKEIMTSADNDTLRAFKIPNEGMAEIKNQLARCGIDQFTIYGDMDHLAKRLKDVHGLI